MAQTMPFRPARKITSQNAVPDGKTVFSLDDGTREVTLVNNYGQVICRLHFRTGELAIMDRYNELMADFPEMVKPLQNIDLNADGTANLDDGWAELKKVEGMLKQKINALLDMNEADEIFRTRNPFSSIGGEFYVEKVLAVLGQAITAQIKEEAALSQARMKKYTEDIDNNGEVSADAGATADKS